MLEAKIQRDIMRYLQLRGFKVYKISDRFRSGIPDLYACRDGRSIWFEVKTPDGRLSKLQEHEIRQLLAAGAQACVVRSVEDVKSVLA
jgi:Holliday junction resolvase